MSSASGAIFAPGTPARSAAASLGAARALARRALRDARTRTLAFGYLFAIYAYIQPAGFRHTYPTVSDRLAFAHSFAGNDALRLFYGYPYNPVTVGGYAAWRVGGTLAIAAAAFGVLAAVRALRTEEDTGRMELILTGAIGRGMAYASAMVAIAACVVVLWLAQLAGYIAGGLPAGESAYLALATTSVVPVFVGVGALVSQLAPTRRLALELSSATVGLFLLLRVIADTSSGAAWLRWATPLGWAEELRPFTGARPLVLALPAVSTVLLLAAAARIAAGRDVGTGLLPANDTAEPRLRLLSSPVAQALRGERGSLSVWLISTGAFAFILGMVSTSISSAGISKSIQREVAKLGSGSILTPTGYLAFVFIFFILVVSLFACAQISAAREEEAEQRLETLLAEPLGRVGWLSGRLALAAAAAAALAMLAGLLTWVGAASQGAGISLARMLEAGANCLPVALLFLGVAALAYALVPRASAGIVYTLVAVAFLWDLVGSLLGVPRWLVELTPFQHVGLVPTQPFRGQAAAIMVAIGALAALAALAVFRRRDLIDQ
ncbi:MAG: polyketide antibiotic transporter [Solirubrobacteraceae bacterium]